MEDNTILPMIQLPQANDHSTTVGLGDTPQRYPHADSPSYPPPATDSSTMIDFAPRQAMGVKRGNWIQTMSNKGSFPTPRLLRLLEPLFTQKWWPSELELVK